MQLPVIKCETFSVTICQHIHQQVRVNNSAGTKRSLYPPIQRTRIDLLVRSSRLRHARIRALP